MSFGTNDGAAAGATWASGCDDAGDLMGECFGGGKCGAASEDWVVVFILCDIVSKDGDPLVFFIVADGHLPHDVFGDVGWEWCGSRGGTFGDTGLNISCES